MDYCFGKDVNYNCGWLKKDEIIILLIGKSFFINSIVICWWLFILNCGRNIGDFFLKFEVLIWFFWSFGFIKDIYGVVFFYVIFDVLNWNIDFLIMGIYVMFLIDKCLLESVFLINRVVVVNIELCLVIFVVYFDSFCFVCKFD